MMCASLTVYGFVTRTCAARAARSPPKPMAHAVPSAVTHNPCFIRRSLPLFLKQIEDDEGTCLRKIGRLGKGPWEKDRRRSGPADEDSDVLFATHRIADRRGAVARARVELPEEFASPRVQRK